MRKRRGLSREGVFIFFLLMVGRRKKNQNSNSIPAQINVCSKPSIKGEAGPGRFKGAERSGEERRGWGEESMAMMGVVRGCPGRKKWGLTTPEVRKKAGGEENGRRRDPHGGKKPWQAGREWSEAEGRGEKLGGGV